MDNKDSKKENNVKTKSGSERLNAEIDLLKSGVADDLVLIREGKEGESGENLKYISFDKDHKNFNRLKVLVTAIRMLEDKPERTSKSKDSDENDDTDTETTDETKTIPKDVGNVFEFVSKRLLEKRVNGK